MSSFNIQHRHFKHSGGTKDYDVWLISDSGDRAMFVKRWGKVGGFGQFKDEIGDRYEMSKFFDKTIDDRLKKGYDDVTDHFDKSINHDSLNKEVEKQLGLCHKRYGAKIKGFIDSLGDFEVSASGADASMPAIKRKPPEEQYSAWGSF